MPRTSKIDRLLPNGIPIHKLQRDRVKLKGTMIIQSVPITTKASFKAACARRGKTMRRVFIKFMKHYARQTFKAGKPEINEPTT